MSVIALRQVASRSVLEVCPIERLRAGGRADAGDGHVRRQLENDEVRILSLLRACGPQPALDIHDSVTMLGVQGITNIGREAGCADAMRVPEYLENLHDLGLIVVSQVRLAERRYEPLDAQIGTGDGHRCSIRLTPLGARYSRSFLPAAV